MISKSRDGLSTIFNRIILAISICDVISSLSLSLASIPCPVESGIWLAFGSTATCNVQGFFNYFTQVTPLYNSSLCIHFLLAIKYEVSDSRRKNIDPFLLGIPAIWGIFSALYYLGTNAFNAHPVAGICWTIEFPIGCDGSDCIRGHGSQDTIVYRTNLFIAFILVPIVIFISLLIIYKTVENRESRSSAYGAASLNISEERRRSSQLAGRRRTRNQTQLTLSRASLYKLIAFSGAWFLTHVLYIIVVAMKQISNILAPPPVYLLMTILYPLQGHFSFLVYIYPTVINIKRSHRNYSWYDAFVSAIKRKLNITIRDEEMRRRDLDFSLAHTRRNEVCEPTAIAGTSSNERVEIFSNLTTLVDPPVDETSPTLKEKEKSECQERFLNALPITEEENEDGNKYIQPMEEGICDSDRLENVSCD